MASAITACIAGFEIVASEYDGTALNFVVFGVYIIIHLCAVCVLIRSGIRYRHQAQKCIDDIHKRTLARKGVHIKIDVDLRYVVINFGWRFLGVANNETEEAQNLNEEEAAEDVGDNPEEINGEENEGELEQAGGEHADVGQIHDNPNDEYAEADSDDDEYSDVEHRVSNLKEATPEEVDHVEAAHEVVENDGQDIAHNSDVTIKVSSLDGRIAQR
eukprot:TRINITY_DN7518_c0_g4_i2.p1 TRINITY_DN7518_c0_g4~~TRINITY_DN7518_c0_g4_i2.p1  ORF type:complete len:216 (-),score=26.07 TRINITY_DN7518_c0_g4_i2:99-746(-)